MECLREKGPLREHIDFARHYTDAAKSEQRPGGCQCYTAVKWFQKPDWQLPSGVPRGTWEYAHSEQVTEDYDGSLGEDGQLPFDLTVLERCFREKGLIVDLGCGTGRLLLPVLPTELPPP